MSKTTAELVHEAADQLLKEGVRPSQQNIRDRIGKGSATTIHKALADWWQQLSARIQHAGNEYQNVPEPVVNAAAALWQQALSRAQAQLDEQHRALQQSYRQKQQELADKSHNAHERIDDLATSLATAYARLEALQQDLDSHKKENIILEKQLIKSESKGVALDRELKSQVLLNRQLEEKAAQLSHQLLSENTEEYLYLQEENKQLKAIIARLDKKLAGS